MQFQLPKHNLNMVKYKNKCNNIHRAGKSVVKLSTLKRFSDAYPLVSKLNI